MQIQILRVETFINVYMIVVDLVWFGSARIESCRTVLDGGIERGLDTFISV